MRLLKILLVPAALVVAPAVGVAAPNNSLEIPYAGQEARDGAITEAAHTYRHWRNQRARRDWRRYNRWQRRHYEPYRYYYRSRCYWSRYWNRTICR